MRPFLLLAFMALLASCDSPTVTPQDVQHQVNYQIEYQLEQPGQDNWQIPKHTGDCEDYALLKRERLIQGGFDPEDLQIHIVLVPGIGGHAILHIVSRDLVLDNNERGVLSWEAWEASYNPKAGCVVGDLTQGSIYPVVRRCKGPVILY